MRKACVFSDTFLIDIFACFLKLLAKPRTDRRSCFARVFTVTVEESGVDHVNVHKRGCKVFEFTASYDFPILTLNVDVMSSGIFLSTSFGYHAQKCRGCEIIVKLQDVVIRICIVMVQ